MDGTLLSSAHTVSEQNKQAVLAAVNQGVHVAITTGRLYHSAKLYGEEIGLNTPIIASNGAYIGDEKGNEIYKNTLTRVELEPFLSQMKQHGLYWYAALQDRLVSVFEFPETNVYVQANQHLPVEQQVKLEVVDSIETLFLNYDGDILKVACMSDDETERLFEVKSHLKTACPDLEIVSSWHNNFELLKDGSSKGKAVAQLARYYNLETSEIMCLGDSENDLSMITTAGVGVAMGNATDEIKAASTFITATNDEDGVAKAIEKFVLTK